VSDSAFIDTNVLLRFLLEDNAEQTSAVSELLRNASQGTVVLYIAASTVSEVVFVLAGRVYSRSRSQLAEALRRVLALPLQFEDRPEVELALKLFAETHDDWDDCLLSAYALTRTAGRLFSFDRGLAHIPGLLLEEPAPA
jgi:predicted nucleic acid-binding protein